VRIVDKGSAKINVIVEDEKKFESQKVKKLESYPLLFPRGALKSPTGVGGKKIEADNNLTPR
jgi:hypothetical protein